MKSSGGMAMAVVVCVSVMLVAIVVVINESDENDSRCIPAGSGGVGSLPAGSTVAPMKAGTYRISSRFGPRGEEFHKGLDFAAAAGTPIYAAADGVVSAAGPASGFGNWIVIDHNLDGSIVSTVYGHMFDSDMLVDTGDQVHAGQEITRVGYNGQVLPPGPAGAHLHFETWAGGRLSGGHATDPAVWLADAADPVASGPGDSEPNASSQGTEELAAAASAPGAPLPPLPASVGSEEHLQLDAIRAARAIAAAFPEVRTIGGWRPSDPFPDHPSGRAIDVMIPQYTTGEGKALGDSIVDFVMSQAQEFRLDYLIWRGESTTAQGQRTVMSDRGGDTANHYDHVHVTVRGGGYPNGSAIIGPTGRIPNHAGDCAPVDVGQDGDLASGSVPPEFEQWYRRAGALCPQISAALLAAQGAAESGFDQHAVSGSGAQGPAQFMPGTWSSYGADDDANGRVSAFDIADALMGQGRYMCAIAQKIDDWIDEGRVHAPNGKLELYLAAYNAGEAAVLASGGFPTGAADYVVQTRPYVDTILASLNEFSDLSTQ
ncbi:M23 family metallopeptidase [Nocardia sp. CNY236]|uniref:M23 family metallopeptidase n=1 Tax=Nocardia sp. CNY236 TaxID=1169152 RepID=UPI0004914F87|nr:M23 family metallopeptidase [Nocardia sp. CNY236]